MIRILLIIIIVMISLSGFCQVRNGWRSIYDRYGRLSRMNYFNNGVNVNDSNYFFQYHADFILKGLVVGELSTDQGCKTGSVKLFDYDGRLSSFYKKKNLSKIFDLTCNEDGECTSLWIDQFDTYTGDWDCDSMFIENGNLIIQNDKEMKAAIYCPELSYKLNKPFILRVKVPVKSNSSKQGIALGWIDEKNYMMFEVVQGKHYSISISKNGNITSLVSAGIIEKTGDDFNEIIINQSDKNLMFQVNGIIEEVLSLPIYASNRIALVGRSKGNSIFSEIVLNYKLSTDDDLFSRYWIGRGNGFYFSSDAKILTTFDVVSNGKSFRIKGIKNGKPYVYKAKLIRKDEDNNLAILQLVDTEFFPFPSLPYGLTGRAPVSDSKVITVGFPNALSGILVDPEVFEGKLLPAPASTLGYKMLELSFRNGMIGAPIFDNNFNLIGVYANRGVEIKYAEMIDFFSNSRLFYANMGKVDVQAGAILKELTLADKLKTISELVVIIESNILLPKGDE